MCRSAPILACALSLVACSDPAPAAPVFPADYAASYVEVRDCRRSPEHELSFIRVLASPDAASIYTSREGTFPAGAVIVKEEYAGEGCVDPIGWTAMLRAPDGSWRWQEVAPDRAVLEDGAIARCAGCHARCVAPGGGFEQTCAEN